VNNTQWKRELRLETERTLLEEYGPGLITVECCQLCGSFAWQSTDASKPDQVVIHDGHPRKCERCAEAHRRSPELASWVRSVAVRLRYDLLGDEET